MALVTTTEDRALSLLGSGVQPEAVAAALGVSPSRISQLMSNESFAAQVTELRFNNLQQHNERDNKYDRLEDKLVDKLDKAVPLMFKPGEILKAIQVINGAKRRGQASPEQVRNPQTTVNVILPTQIIQRFTTNLDNQVIKAGDQDLLTMPSGSLLQRVEDKEKSNEQKIEHTSSTAALAK